MSANVNYNKNGEPISFTIRLYKGKNENGKDLSPHKKTIKIKPGINEKQLEKLIAKETVLFESEIRDGICNQRVFFRDFAAEIITVKLAAGVERSTISRYESMLKLRILPRFGHLKVNAITPHMLNAFYMDLAKPGENKFNGKPLSPKTIVEYHRLMSSIFS